MKNWHCNASIYREEIYQYIYKKYCTIYIGRKEKYRNCEDLPSKCTNNSNYLYYYLKGVQLGNTPALIADKPYIIAGIPTMIADIPIIPVLLLQI